jgi:hypothetical protein
VITAAITAAVAAVLALFGIKPGAYLVVVAGVVKAVIVIIGLLLGRKLLKARMAAQGKPPGEGAAPQTPSAQAARAQERTQDSRDTA